MKSEVIKLAKKVIADGNVVELIVALMAEGVDRKVIRNAIAFKHQIRDSHTMAQADMGGMLFEEGNFEEAFCPAAYQWCDAVAQHKLHLTRKIHDNTLAKYHWSNADGTRTAELR